MIIPYRTRRLLQRIAVTALIVFLAVALVWGCWLLWLHKYVVFTADGGAVLDFSLAPMSGQGELATPPENVETIPIYYNEGDNAINISKELTQLIGYYVEPDAMNDLAAVRSQIHALPTGTPVMIDVKSIYGSFYYNSSVSAARSTDVDSAAMDELLDYLDKAGMYTIARLPGLRDKDYGLSHDEDGVFHSSRGYLWMDDNGCYWLNPTREGTITHLTQIVNELKGLGFDEVVFYDFCFPDTTNIYFDGDQAQAVSQAAQTLVTTCATDSFAVSFVGSEGFIMPEGRSRLYVESASAAEAPTIAANSGVADTAIGLVFLTENHDTRFDVYSVLRPLSAAH